MVAISQIQQGTAPDLDEISIEMLKLGGEECVCWLRLLQM